MVGHCEYISNPGNVAGGWKAFEATPIPWFPTPEVHSIRCKISTYMPGHGLSICCLFFVHHLIQQ